jgi:hypothetical protein
MTIARAGLAFGLLKGGSSLSPGALKGIGIGCFVLCAILLFVAWERYQDHARKVKEANRVLEFFVGVLKQTTGSAPVVEDKSEPGVPPATMLSLLFAALSAIGGAVCFVVAAKKGIEQLRRLREENARLREQLSGHPRSEAVVSATNCPACGAAISPEAARCPGCQIALR